MREGNKHTLSRYQFVAPFYNVMEWPVEQLWYKRWRRKLWAHVNGPKVLEIGVGTGKNIPHYPKNLEITGIDLSSGMLKKAKKLSSAYANNHIHLRVMDAQQMEFTDNTFDDAVATFVFCSVPDPVRGLKEALRVTKPGGKLHLLEHMRSRNQSLGKVMDKLDKPFHYLSGVHIARRTVVNVKMSGWELTDVRDLNPTGIFRRIEAVKPRQ